MQRLSIEFARLSRALAIVCAVCAFSVLMTAQEPDKAAAKAGDVARDALAAHLRIAPEDIEIARVSPAMWRDTSLGCPEPGKVYAAVITRGHVVRLRAREGEHEVHVAGSRHVICDPAEGRASGSAALAAASAEAGDAVTRALTQRLGVDRSAIRIVSSRPARAAKETCPGAPPTASGAAFIIEARVGVTTYRYYSDAAVTRTCDA